VQIAMFVGPVALTWVLLIAIARQAEAAAEMTLTVPVVVGVAIVSCVGGGMLLRWRGLELRSDCAVVRVDTVTRIPWAEVRDVRTRRRFGVDVLVLETERRQVRCPAPFSGMLTRDRDFDAKAAYVQRWWQACAPGATPGPRGDTGWGHPVLPGDLVG
jgi:hypothetical protein